MKESRVVVFISLLFLAFAIILSPALADSEPVITVQPSPVSVDCFSPFSLTAEASGGSLSYQWQYRTVGIDWTDWQNMTSASVTAVAVSEFNEWDFRCVVSNNAGSVESDTVNVSVLPIADRYNWPSTAVKAGDPVSLEVITYGQDVSCQWYLSSNGTSWEKWEGKNGRICEFTASSDFDKRYIDCRLTDKYGHTASTRDSYLYKISVVGSTACDEEKTLYFLGSTYKQYLGSVPAEYPQRLNYTGKSVQILEGGKHITVTNGVITPKATTVYWYGGYGYSYPISGKEADEVETRYESGDSVVQVDGKKIIIHVIDYAAYYADSVIDSYIRDNITDTMTDMEKARKICQFVANRDYGNTSNWIPLVITGKGDCWASTYTILHMAEKLGIEAMPNDERGKDGAGSGHYNAIALLDGKYCVLEAGYGGKAPRAYTIRPYDDPYDYQIISSGSVSIKSFLNLDEVTDVVIPSVLDEYSLIQIGYHAFIGHSEITSIIIPEGVTVIDAQAFMDCTGLETVTVPATVTSLAADAFYGCSSLTEIQVAENNPSYRSIDGVLFTKDGTKLIAFPGGKTESYTIPSTVTSIEEFAFAGASPERVILPDSMEAIPEYAFSYSSVRFFVLPRNLKRIEEGAFYQAEVPAIVLPEGVEFIGPAAFSTIYTLRINIPASVTEIGPYAFEGCSSSLISFEPDCNPAIGEEAFSGATLAVYESTGPWQYAINNDVNFRLLGENGKIPLEASWFSLRNPTSILYTGQPIDFSKNLMIQKGASVRSGCDFCLIPSDSLKIGPGKLTIKGIGNYTGTVQLDYRIQFYDANRDGIIDTKDLIYHLYGQKIMDNACVLPTSIREIGPQAFSGTSFQVVFIPKGVRSISNDAFEDGNHPLVVIPDESWIPWAAESGLEYLVSID